MKTELSELGKILQVDESTVSKLLKVLGMIHKQRHWVPYDLKPRDVEWHFVTCEPLLQRQRRKYFLHRIVIGDEKWKSGYTRIIQSVENRGVSPAMHQHRSQNQKYPWFEASFLYLVGLAGCN